MLHRSTLLAILSTALLLPGAAHAASSGTVVAGPAADGSTITARVVHGSLCLLPQLTKAVLQDHLVESSSGAGCTELPALAPWSFEDGLAGYARRGGGGLDAGLTGSDVVAVELRKGGRVLAHVATQPSPLPQVANVRFYAISSTEDADEVAYLDGAGTVRRAADPGTNPVLGARDDALQSAPHTVISGRTAHGGGRWKLQTSTISPIVSTPLAPERRVAYTCAGLRVSAPGRGSGGTGTCDASGREGEQLLPFLGTTCGPAGLFVGALVRSGVMRLSAVLGDGTTRAIALHAAPGGLRVGAVVLGRAIGVRRLVATAPGGRTDSFAVAMAPASSQDCSQQSSVGSAILEYARALSDTPLGDGAHHLVVADHDQDLCFAVDRAPRAPGDCTVPPVEPAATQLLTQPTQDGRFVAALVPADVASVRVTLDDGSTQVLAASPISGYAGQYAQQVHAIEATLPGPRRVLAYTMLGAGGHAVSREWDGPDRPRLRVVERLGRVPGVAGTLTFSRAIAPRALIASAQTTCLSFGPPPAGDRYGYGCLGEYPNFGLAHSSCATRQTLFVLGLAHRTDRVAVRLASGREVAAHVYALPAGADAKAVAIAVLGAHDAARTIIRRGGSPARVALKLPAPADQCGFYAWADFESQTFD